MNLFIVKNTSYTNLRVLLIYLLVPIPHYHKQKCLMYVVSF